MADFTVVDTDILIDVGRGVREAISFLKNSKAKASLPSALLRKWN